MQVSTTDPRAAAPARARLPWVASIAALGVLWNAYGVLQFVNAFSQTRDSLMAAGMTAQQAGVYLALPGWITAAFGAGVAFGLIGATALLVRQRSAPVLLALSLAAYLLLFAGDAYHGVFTSMPLQLAVLAAVVVIAAVLLTVAVVARNQAWRR